MSLQIFTCCPVDTIHTQDQPGPSTGYNYYTDHIVHWSNSSPAKYVNMLLLLLAGICSTVQL